MGEIIDDIEIPKNSEDKSIIAMVKWWEKKRLYYNLSIILAGIFTLKGAFVFTFFFFVPVLIYLLCANLFYCLGWGIEILIISYFNSSIRFGNEARWFIFVLGTLFGGVLTYYMIDLGL